MDIKSVVWACGVSSVTVAWYKLMQVVLNKGKVRCQRCGSSARCNGVLFCYVCGSRLRSAGPAPAPAATPAQPDCVCGCTYLEHYSQGCSKCDCQKYNASHRQAPEANGPLTCVCGHQGFHHRDYRFGCDHCGCAKFVDTDSVPDPVCKCGHEGKAHGVMGCDHCSCRDFEFTGPAPAKEYSPEVHDGVARAKAWAEQKRAEGWTKQDFAAGLKRMFDSPTGDVESPAPAVRDNPADRDWPNFPGM